MTDPAVKKKWYQVWWKTVIGAAGVLTAVFGILEGTYWFTAQWHDYQVMKKKVMTLDTGDVYINQRLITLEKYLEEKNRSFAVGFRVFKEQDELTGNVTYRKMYRDWSGKWNEVFIDFEYSQEYGVNYYYYIDKTNGAKVYCW